ncbi:hypothetical protein [Nocardioides nematodiphilus]|uniref:hypothetical protein n=1 Tax=Nocardioides nematodiphilus TaxID=2849669 RepID=UPI001CD999EB|nr:hypothetical protein [Nocardioides nematodiphilus]MCA1981758.1 hypothetical protein [Nocardioides nematodiphilus]
MRLTEKEMTAALTGVAKQVVAAQDKSVRKGKVSVDELWELMTRYQRYVVLNGLGDQVLPVLVALPDVEVAIGERPQYTDEQITEAVEAQLGDEGRLRRKMLLTARVALVRIALESIPPKADPEAFVVPDFL